MQKNKVKGIILILLPFILLILVLSAYAISRSIMSSSASNQELPVNADVGLRREVSPAVKTAQIINVVLSLVGVLSVISMLILIPLGIYFLAKKDPNETQDLVQSEKYQGLTPEQIKFINSWSWGAFLGTGIWAVGNKLYVWLVLSLIPVVNIYAWIKLAASGRKMAWEKGWDSFDQFKKRQKIMLWVILLIGVLVLALEVYSAKSDKINSVDSTQLPVKNKTAEQLKNTQNSAVEINATVEDSDNDGLVDVWEKRLMTDLNNPDTDGDGLSDGDEVLVWKTSPTNPDTDGDSFSDAVEIKSGHNPLGEGNLVR